MDKLTVFSSNLILKILKIILFLVGLGYVGYLIYGHWSLVVKTVTNLSTLDLVILIGVGVIANLFFARLFSIVLVPNSGLKNRLNSAFRSYVMSQISKYIPGKVWQLFHQMASNKDSTPGEVIRANVVFMFLLTPMILCLSVFLLVSSSLVIFLSSCSLLIISLAVWYLTLNGRISDIFYQRKIILVLAAITFVIGLLLLVNFISHNGSNAHTNMQVAGLLGIGWSLSLVFFVFPAGLGVREWIIVELPMLVGIQFQAKEIVILALMMRLWQISYELVSIMIVKLLSRTHIK
ncbi:hypothetical protein [Pleionea mediterranea]|uniref:Lysylphosphatidylglycerol synthase-like protein n=1 Tax=Pleionea mediterranea TaxID=523701 RepID=A0A316GHZ3_9GAMM|nr:hypothetical protein [Pleionea mediterranea]PWK54397.1 hypothetical protein C8D97_101245 [Pleionea mediterranea]